MDQDPIELGAVQTQNKMVPAPKELISDSTKSSSQSISQVKNPAQPSLTSVCARPAGMKRDKNFAGGGSVKRTVTTQNAQGSWSFELECGIFT